MHSIGSWLIIAALGVSTLFQLALALGAPMGEYVFGGRVAGRLTALLRFASLATAGFYVAVIGHQLAQLQILPRLLPAPLNTAANWALVAIFAISFVLHLASKSKKERDLWTPIALLVLVAAVPVALAL